jgi:hypothetical protein
MKQFFLFAAFLLFVVSSANAQNHKESIKTPKPNPVGQTLSTGQPTGQTVSYINEGFEDTLFPPLGWTATTTTGTVVWEREYGFGYTGNASALANYSTPANEKWLITPQVTIAAGDSLTFWIRRSYSVAYPPDSLYVLVSTTNANLTSFTHTLMVIDVANGLANAWARLAASVNAFAGQNVYIAFKHVNTDGNGFNMDDVAVGTQIVPVEFVSFTANVVNSSVELQWATATETNNMGFEVERKVGESTYQKVGYVGGNGTTTQSKEYKFIDAGLVSGKYSYRLKQVDFDGKYEYSNEVFADISVPAEYSLAQNFPNPFNPSTSIQFTLKVDAKVSLRLFDALGQEVRTILNDNYSLGSYKIDVNAADLNSGVYFYTIDASGVDGSKFSSTKKMILMK